MAVRGVRGRVLFGLRGGPVGLPGSEHKQPGGLDGNNNTHLGGVELLRERDDDDIGNGVVDAGDRNRAGGSGRDRSADFGIRLQCGGAVMDGG